MHREVISMSMFALAFDTSVGHVAILLELLGVNEKMEKVRYNT